MLKLHSKRTFDDIRDDDPSYFNNITPIKRFRPCTSVNTFLSQDSESSPFIPSRPFNKDIVESYLPSRKRRRVSFETTQKLYSLDEIKQIAEKIVAEKEKNVKKEYDDALKNLSNEQFSIFSTINQDNHLLKTSDFSYMC
eukprot:TRINITY_DN721_c0_g1_i2.p1 TRINITY_DN721_c0_g1~~TRINITY_DN721_c0_g1_i2.p1  ORF type:complete len:140 (+),score=18.38 TRINITY_DN721_c0_g1_i2:87-506(+)